MQQGDLVPLRRPDRRHDRRRRPDASPTRMLAEMERSACPTCGSCSGMFTANSMNCLMEALGLALPGNGTIVATHADRKQLFLEAGRRIVDLARRYYEQDDASRPAARHRHLRRLRERHDAGHRHGRLHQHRAAPAGRRAGSRGAVHHARHRPPLPPRAEPLQGGALLARRARGRRAPRRRRLRHSRRTGPRPACSTARSHTVHAPTMGDAIEQWDVQPAPRSQPCATSIAPRPAAYAPPSRSARAARYATLDLDRANGRDPRRRARLQPRTAAWRCSTATSPRTAAS